MRVTIPTQLLVHSCPVGIYLYFNEWWFASSMKVKHVDRILFLAFVMSMNNVILQLDDLYADTCQLPPHFMVVNVRLNLINHLVSFIPCQIYLYFSN